MLNKFQYTMLFALFLSCTTPAPAGEIVTCFDKGKLGSCSQSVLQDVKFKSVVLQFVDPAETGLGESLSRLLWREILESISDLRGAGVILAYDQKGDIEKALGRGNLSDFLEHDYHAAATAIAEQQNVQMSIWGAVLEDGSDVFVQTFLTLREGNETPWARLTLSINRFDGANISSLLGRNRLNLAPLRGTRAELFGRNFVTRCASANGCPDGIALRAAALNEARITNYVPVESQVEVVDMNRQWLKVSREGSEPAWINISHVEVFPQEIEFLKRTDVNLRNDPGGRSLGKVNLDGRFTVLNARRFGEFLEPWYLIEAGTNRGWVAGRLVNRRSYTFPAVHLIAALYRYGRGQYKEAQKELETFLSRTSEQDNVTRATALQFLAASRVAGQRIHSGNIELAINELDSAAKLTPFDSRVYTLRAVIKAGSRDQVVPAMEDLNRALELNHRDPEAARLLQDFNTTSKQYGLDVFTRGRETDAAQLKLDALLQRYAKPNEK